jgi:hypothetical protein
LVQFLLRSKRPKKAAQKAERVQSSRKVNGSPTPASGQEYRTGERACIRGKKPDAVMVDGIPIKPISPAEHRRLEKRIKKKYEKLRRRYPSSWQELDFALA